LDLLLINIPLAKKEMKNIPKYVGPEPNSIKRKRTKKEIKARFNAETASLYSQGEIFWLPEYEYALELISKAIKPYLSSSAKVLDLGAGTGNLSRKILESFDDCHITLIDFSDNMLSEVSNVLAKFKGRYETIVGDFFNLKIPEESYDSVVSSFALHHGRSDGIYKGLYQKIYNWLKVPGVFVCCDVVEGDTRNISELNEEGWYQFLQKSFSDEEVKKIFSNYRQEDSPISIKKHLNLLILTLCKNPAPSSIGQK